MFKLRFLFTTSFYAETEGNNPQEDMIANLCVQYTTSYTDYYWLCEKQAYRGLVLCRQRNNSIDTPGDSAAFKETSGVIGFI